MGTSRSVRASSMPRSAWCALVFQTFCPLITQLSPSRTAEVDRPARSEPAPGSLNSWHHVCSPVRIGRSRRSRSSSLPCARIVGAASQVPLPTGMPTAPSRSSSLPTSSSAQAGSPRPCQRCGQLGTAQPDVSSSSRQVRSAIAGSQCCADPLGQLGTHLLGCYARASMLGHARPSAAVISSRNARSSASKSSGFSTFGACPAPGITTLRACGILAVM